MSTVTTETSQLKSARRRQLLLGRKRLGIVVMTIGAIIFGVQTACQQDSLSALYDNGVYTLAWIIPLLIGGVILGVAAEGYYNEFVRLREGVIISLYKEEDEHGFAECVVLLEGFTVAGERRTNRITVSATVWQRLEVDQHYYV